jgi:magnesium chelatase family protein
LYAKVYGETTVGLNGALVIVEVDIARGLPGFEIVGLPDLAVKESRERVRTALKNSGFPFPQQKITVNLAPASVKKDGSGLDLPIAIGILISSGLLPQEKVRDKIFIGELSLEGVIREVHGVLPMVIQAGTERFRKFIFPRGTRKKAASWNGCGSLRRLPCGSWCGICSALSGAAGTPRTLQEELAAAGPALDFAEVRGQLVVKRALEIAAAGGHNILLEGTPGSGKTMLARRLPSILPPLTEQEALEVTKIYSIAGLLSTKGRLMARRPFRSPHHTISCSALAGGGGIPKPGEVTLSHNGVLFLDELPEFSRAALEVLRQPLEDGFVSISRVQAAYTFPASFLLCCAQNPCPCGYLGDSKHQCTCRPGDIERYQRKVSGPLLDRIDIQVQVPRVEFKDLRTKAPGEKSAVIRERVCAAREIQLQRLQPVGLYCNAQMSHREVERFCQLDAPSTFLAGTGLCGAGFVGPQL